MRSIKFVDKASNSKESANELSIYAFDKVHIYVVEQPDKTFFPASSAVRMLYAFDQVCRSNIYVRKQTLCVILEYSIF
jgi:hypothetical protein